MGKVFITDYISNPDIEKSILGEHLTDKLSSDVAVLLVWHEQINQHYCKQLPNLKGVVRYGVGYDSLDLTFLKSRNIVACNTPDYGTEEVADTALAMILNVARGITRYDFLCRDYENGSWQENTIKSLKRNSDITLGIIGAGRIGGSVILKAGALRFKTIFYDKYKERGYEKLLGAQRVETLEELLALSDIVSIHVPLTSETEGIIDERFISKMRNGASLINTARGKIVKNLDVFYEPLQIGNLASVALDVLPDEPPIDCRLIRAWKFRERWLEGRLIINPHTAYYSKRAFIEMREKAAQNALRILRDETPFNSLN
jgi:D-3-phosphoglycerate dehydrogenase